jgi:hypothetical protein
MTFQTPSEQQAQADQQSAAEPGGQRWSPVEALPAGWLPVCRTGSFSVPIRPSLSRPGQTGTMTAKITPNTPSGTVVSGFLKVDTLNGTTSK